MAEKIEKLRESRRFSSLADMNRTIKRQSKNKLPLTLMFLGQSGLGITSLVEMLLFDASPPEIRHMKVEVNGEEKEVAAEEVEGQEGIFYREISCEYSAGLKISFLDFQGFDEPNTRKISPIVEMIKRRFASYLESNDIEFMVRANASKEKVERKKVDCRVHGCFYLVAPGGVTFSDVKCMKLLADVVNLIPVIGRADSLGEEELGEAKETLADDLDSSEVLCYGNVIPSPNTQDQESVKMVETFSILAEKMPFAVVTSIEKITIDGKSVFGREYAWGQVNAKDERYSDFLALQELIENNADDLKMRTNEVVYEEYRKARLAALKHLPANAQSS